MTPFTYTRATDAADAIRLNDSAHESRPIQSD